MKALLKREPGNGAMGRFLETAIISGAQAIDPFKWHLQVHRLLDEKGMLPGIVIYLVSLTVLITPPVDVVPFLFFLQHQSSLLIKTKNIWH